MKLLDLLKLLQQKTKFNQLLNKTISLFCFILLLFISIGTNAQSTYQTIRGTVLDKQSQLPIEGVTILLVGSNPINATLSNAEGKFAITNVSPGRYEIKVTFMGYKEMIIPNVFVSSGKEVILDISIEEIVNSIKEVAITANKKSNPNNEMTTVSTRSFSMEEVNRYSGGQGDPARLAASFAGVVMPNDQRNDLVIRGNSPSGVLWRIDGLNVPNLNHFAVMGSTGGPVSALNTNVLKNSDFMTAAFPAEYGNATAGVFDLGFRKGNSDKYEHMFQFGAFTGLEAMTEGPISRKTGASYMIAYRYSFTGLAQAMGFSIGTAATPNYQDVAFKITSGKTKAGTFTLFGLGGYSKIKFLHDKIDSSDVFADPTRDAYNVSKVGLIGLSHFIPIGKKSFMKTVIGATYNQNLFDQDTLNAITNDNPNRVIELSSREIHYTLHTSFNTKFNARFNIRAGIIAEILNLNLLYKTREYTPDWIDVWNFKGNTLLIQEYVQAKYSISDKISLNGGLHLQQLTLNGSYSIEPRLAMKYQATPRSSFTLGYGWHEQMQPLTVYFYQTKYPDGTYNKNNRKLGFTRSQHIVIGYEFLPGKDWKIRAETYFQYIDKVPVSSSINSFSLLNEGASFIPTQVVNLVNKGKGMNYGIELTVEKLFSKGYYGLITASLYQSKYKGSDDVERNTAFNGTYTVNFLAGKEFRIGKIKQHAFTLDTKFTSAGGRYYTPIDLAASQEAKEQVLKSDDYAFTEQLPNYYRWDFKIGFRYNHIKNKVAQSFFMDMQNVINHKNVFAQQYNKVSNQINTTYQNGFLPNFVYKLTF